MISDLEPMRPVSVHGKFFSRNGQKFFLKAMRLPDVSATLDFEQKVRLLGRLDGLRQAHTTALILSEAQSNPVLDLGAQAGLYSVVEIELSPDELTTSSLMPAAISRVSHLDRKSVV